MAFFGSLKLFTTRFSFINYQYLNDNFDKNPELTLHDLIQKYTFEELNGHFGLVNTSKERTPKQVVFKLPSLLVLAQSVKKKK